MACGRVLLVFVAAALAACSAESPPVVGAARAALHWEATGHVRSADWVLGDGFGASARGTNVAIDGTTLVVGAPTRDEGATDTGAVYVFVASGTTWTQQQKLVPPGLGANARFGTAVDVSGDTLVASTLAGTTGAAYVYVRSGTTWSLQQTLTPSETLDATDTFGRDVAIDGDTIAVGNDNNDDGATNAGLVYVFTRAGTVWTEQAELRGSRTGAGSASGQYLAVDGDTIALWGGILPDISAGIVHLVYVFTRAAGVWTQQRELAGMPDRSFGIPLALDGDTLALPQGGTGPVVRVFTRAGATWSLQQQVSTTATDSIDLAGDRLVVGRLLRGGGGGTVTVIERVGTMWSVVQTLTGDDTFGPTVALAPSWLAVDLTECFFRCPPNEDAVRLHTLVPERPNGAACTMAAECTSRNCVDGVCCDDACGMGVTTDCQACSAAAGGIVDGTCGPLSAAAAAGVVCRAASGLCDAAERCAPTSRACPGDSLATAGTECRPAAGACDAPESCTGTSPACPADARRTCNDGDVCTTDACTEPIGCTATPIAGCCRADVDCGDGDACTADRCTGPGGTCTFPPIAGCCTTAAECDDGNVCTADRCDATTRLCVRDAVPGCCRGPADCDDGDACTTDGCDVATGTCSSARRLGCCLTAGDCDDGMVCTADTCPVAGATCDFTAIAGCCLDDAGCDDGDACTIDACDATSRCSHARIAGCGPDAGVEADAGPEADAGGGGEDAGPIDGGAGADAGAGVDAGPGRLVDAGLVDAGAPRRPRDEGGCCHVAGAGRSPRAGLMVLLVVLGLAVMRRRTVTRRPRPAPTSAGCRSLRPGTAGPSRRGGAT